MEIKQITSYLDSIAPPSYQESYDNAGLICGNPHMLCSGIICTLDATEEVINEAITKKCNLVVAHHPIIFGGLKKITGKTYVERAIITAIKNDIAIYAIHTNLDNIVGGVNSKMAEKLGLINQEILLPKHNSLMKLVVFVPESFTEKVRQSIFDAGAGNIGNYSECSFNSTGVGTFKPEVGANPVLGEIGKREQVNENKIEVIFPVFLKDAIVKAMQQAHPYEEVAYDLIPLANTLQTVGSGLIGELSESMEEIDFLDLLKNQFNLPALRHTNLLGQKIKKVALCGGAGIFLIKHALAAQAHIFITADVKYHEFFDCENKVIIADIGHWESEQFTIELLFDFLTRKYPTFAVLKSEIRTNPVFYFV